ncbi:hypothetical protein OIU76_010147 [Salix suchowensis]|nr:hypothetical protein OIU76_010147 [Salix suchowensis]
MSATTAKDPIRAVWIERLSSALRTALACSVVGCTTLYGPAKLSHFLAYPAFSYVTAILIVSDATLGDTLRGCWHTLYATVQVMIPCILSLHLIGPARFGSGLAAVAVAITTFMVALPESTPLMAKRIAFGQTVIVYVGAAIHGSETGVVTHPIHVASSTALGALASVLATLLPYPRLACCKVRKTRRLYVENVSERLNIYVEALTAQNKQAATDLLSRAKFISVTGAKHLQTIKDNRGGMVCEKSQIRKLDPGENLQDIEILMKGVEIAVDSCPSFPLRMIDEGIKQALLDVKGKIGLKLQKRQAELPAFFFLYCLELLLREFPVARNPECSSENTDKTDTRDVASTRDEEKANLRETWSFSAVKLPNMERWTFAIKSSLSLGFAVLLGLIFNRENGYWSGLIIATSVVTERQATFTVTNARGQGTAIGSVYGILCCFIFQRLVDLRFLPLLPWIIFTSFLRHSRMYGQAGGISAVTGALLILGRKNYGPPNEFAAARLVEACIGLICFIMVEILWRPARAATLAKTELAGSLSALRDCINDISHLGAGQKSVLSSSIPALRRKHQEVKSRISNLEKFIAEAEVEPNFWFLPFYGACYRRLLVSLRKTEHLLLFVAFEIETLSQVSDRLKELINNIYLHPLAAEAGFSLNSIGELISISSLRKISISDRDEIDELGKSSPSADVVFWTFILDGEIENSNEEADEIEKRKGAQELKSRLILCIYSLEFCITSLIKETREIEKHVKELVAWENP